MAILHAGQRLGAYTVEDLLGTGGMAEVYRATHQTLERTVAIKVINPAFNADPTFPLRFLREAKAVASLSHPNIITVYDFGEQGQLAYLVMEIAAGGTFRERAAQLRTLSEAVTELGPIADALGYAHMKGIVHRDLKPINLLLTDQQRLLLADFGLARVASESLDLELSDGGMIMGTPYYMAPEQALGEDVDQRADIYAFGILTFEVLAGTLPYLGNSALAVMQQHLKAPPPSIRSVIPEAPPLLEAAITRATAKRRIDRFNSTAEFMTELREAAQQAPDLLIGKARTTPPPAVPAPAPQPPAAAPQPSLMTGDPADMPTLSMPIEMVAHLQADEQTPPTEEMAPQADTLDGATEIIRPVPRPAAAPLAEWAAAPVVAAGLATPIAVAAAASLAPGDPVGHLSGVARVRRRASSFNQFHWLTIGTALLVVVFINAVGLWLTRAGIAANSGNLLEGINRYIYDNLPIFKSVMTGLALVLAALAVFSMRAAIVDTHHISPQMYRRLRQYHRLVGYGAVVVALAVGFLTCVGIFGFGTASPRAILHSVLGTALLVTIFVKLAVVRYFPAQRRHLKLIGEGLLVLFLLVFATSTVPYLWDRATGGSGSTYHYPTSGQTVR